MTDAPPPQPVPTRTVLVVDDSKVSRDVVVGLLRNRLPGVRFVEAADGAGAMAAARQATPELIVMDFSMPGQTGIEAAEALRHVCPSTPLILLTANGQAPLRERAQALGIPLLRKPIGPAVADEIAARMGAAA